MSTASVTSQKSETKELVRAALEVGGHLPAHKARLLELFSLIEKEFDILYDENQDLKAKLATISGSGSSSTNHLNLSQPLRKQTSNETIGATTKVQAGESLGAKSLGKLGRFNMKLPKQNKAPKQKGPGRKYIMLKDFKEHRDGLWEVSSCPWDVGYFATASADHTARICSADGSRPSVVYLAHMGSVNSIRFHPVDRLVCTASGDRSCHIWKLPQQSQLKITTLASDKNKGESGYKPRPKPWTPILSPDEFPEGTTPGTSPTISSLPITFDPSGRPGSSHFGQGNAIPSSNTTNPISIPFTSLENKGSHEASPTNELVEETANIAESAGNIVVRSALQELKGHTGPVVAGAWTSSNSVATVSWDHTARVWNADTGRQVASLTSGHDKTHKITNVNTHPTSSVVLFSVSDGSFRLWDYRTMQHTHENKPEVVVVTAHQGPVAQAVFSSDGNSILSGGEDRLLKIWDFRNTKVPKATIRCHSAINRFAISPVTNSIVIPTDGKRSSIYDISGARVGKFFHYEKHGHKSMVTSAAWSNDESVIFTAGFDRRVVAWGSA